MRQRTFATLALAAACIIVSLTLRAEAQKRQPASSHASALVFETSANCLACHNGLTTAGGEDISIGSSWRASMMANSARDPYWQAAVRREAIDHPSIVEKIEDECSTCHMPMARAVSKSNDRPGRVFAHLPFKGEGSDSALAADGVSCMLCHQITSDRLGSPESFTGNFVIKPPGPSGERPIFGPFQVDAGRASVMHSVTGATPSESTHLQKSDVCATCHTLHTEAFGLRGEVIGSLPEQMPFLEWQHSAFRTERSCQSCHMPEVAQPTAVAAVLGQPRDNVSRHTFLGGNFFMLRMLNRFRGELGVEALPNELEAAARGTIQQLQERTATIRIDEARLAGNELTFNVNVTSDSGHKFPTGYPARRAWLHVKVRDGSGRTVFESGGITAAGAIQGNDGDDDPAKYEPHFTEIRRADDVQIYESVMTDSRGAVTTGLLSGTAFVKDNRLLPAGFDKTTAQDQIRVRGGAATDPDFTAAGDRVRYVVAAPQGSGPFAVDAELCYQPIAYRWAQNLKRYDAAETRRFVRYYEAMAAESSIVLARAASSVR